MLRLSRRPGEGLRIYWHDQLIMHLVIEMGNGHRVSVLMDALDEVRIQRDELPPLKAGETCLTKPT